MKKRVKNYRLLDWKKGRLEFEANFFALQILIPRELLKKDLEKNLSVKELANKYNVTEKMMLERIELDD